MLNKTKLLAWLEERASDRTSIQGLVITAVYLGLITRVQRGDFDMKEVGR